MVLQAVGGYTSFSDGSNMLYEALTGSQRVLPGSQVPEGAPRLKAPKGAIRLSHGAASFSEDADTLYELPSYTSPYLALK